MALGESVVITNRQGRELKEHGTSLFPVACYYDDLAVESVPWHWHDELEAVVVEAGCAIVGVDGQTYTAEQGSGFFIRPGSLHNVLGTDSFPCRLLSVVFHPRLVGGSIDSIFWQGYLEPLLSDPAPDYTHLGRAIPWESEALKAIEDAWEACAAEQSGYEFQVRACLSRLIFLLSGHRPPMPRMPSEKALRDEARIKKMLKYVQEHFDEALTASQIAQSAAVSESECLRCFRSMIDTTPIQYVRQYRIQKAAELLAGTDQKIADIGAQCGFQEMSYFSKIFREMKGCLPSEYRKRNQNRRPVS